MHVRVGRGMANTALQRVAPSPDWRYGQGRSYCLLTYCQQTTLLLPLFTFPLDIFLPPSLQSSPPITHPFLYFPYPPWRDSTQTKTSVADQRICSSFFLHSEGRTKRSVGRLNKTAAITASANMACSRGPYTHLSTCSLG